MIHPPWKLIPTPGSPNAAAEGKRNTKSNPATRPGPGAKGAFPFPQPALDRPRSSSRAVNASLINLLGFPWKTCLSKAGNVGGGGGALSCLWFYKARRYGDWTHLPHCPCICLWLGGHVRWSQSLGKQIWKHQPRNTSDTSFFIDKVKQCIALINNGYLNGIFLIALAKVGRKNMLFWKGPHIDVETTDLLKCISTVGTRQWIVSKI